MVTGQLSKGQFKQMMKSVKSLLDKIESQRLATLPDAELVNDLNPSKQTSDKPQSQTDELDFLKAPSRSSNPMQSAQVKDPFSGNMDDFFAGLDAPASSSTPSFTPAFAAASTAPIAE
jgi:hypothetical protein